MLLLLFRVGDERYGLEASQIVEVVPLVCLKMIPQSPDYIAGLFDYRGRPVPVIDLCRLGSERSCKVCMTSRIIMLNYGVENGPRRILGLLAEQVTETVKRDPAALISSDISITAAPWLGDLVKDSEGMLQLIDVDGLLSKTVQTSLFSAES
ncbi:MAG: purine-binding chemotaxis protein CheW [Gammaproteobacteria bacterium]|nr:purine-binding chemotaxis protein CheW [Gammaproteobacteria bacterium]